MTYKIRNLTPHEISFPDGKSIPPESGPAPRLPEACVQLDAELDAPVPLVEKTWGDAANLPEPEDGVLLVVSALIANAHPERSDLVTPQTERRDGKIICTALVRSATPKARLDAAFKEGRKSALPPDGNGILCRWKSDDGHELWFVAANTDNARERIVGLGGGILTFLTPESECLIETF